MDQKIKQIILNNDRDRFDILMDGKNASFVIALAVGEIVDSLNYDFFRYLVEHYSYFIVYLIAALLSTDCYFINYLFKNHHRICFNLLVEKSKSIIRSTESRMKIIVKNLIHIIKHYCNLHQRKKILKIIIDNHPCLDLCNFQEIEKELPELLTSHNLENIIAPGKMVTMKENMFGYFLNKISSQSLQRLRDYCIEYRFFNKLTIINSRVNIH